MVLKVTTCSPHCDIQNIWVFASVRCRVESCVMPSGHLPARVAHIQPGRRWKMAVIRNSGSASFVFGNGRQPPAAWDCKLNFEDKVLEAVEEMLAVHRLRNPGRSSPVAAPQPAMSAPKIRRCNAGAGRATARKSKSSSPAAAGVSTSPRLATFQVEQRAGP